MRKSRPRSSSLHSFSSFIESADVCQFVRNITRTAIIWRIVCHRPHFPIKRKGINALQTWSVAEFAVFGYNVAMRSLQVLRSIRRLLSERKNTGFFERTGISTGKRQLFETNRNAAYWLRGLLRRDKYSCEIDNVVVICEVDKLAFAERSSTEINNRWSVSRGLIINPQLY